MRDATQPEPVALLSMPRGKGSREYGKLTVHEFLKYEALSDGTIPPWSGAKLRIHEDCKNLIRTLPSRPVDPKNSEDVLEGGEDHLYDSLRYGLTCRFPRSEEPDFRSVPTDKHPGWDVPRRQRRPRYLDLLEQQEAQAEMLRQQGRFWTGYRYGTPQPLDDDDA